jgi:hypothetical protein
MKDREGFAGVIAAIFMVLIVLFLVYNVSMFTLNQNTAFQSKTNQSDQLIIDQNNEQIVVNVPSRPVVQNTGKVIVPLDVTDTSPLSIEIVSVWVQDLSITSNPNYNRTTTSIALQPGTTIIRNVTVSVASAKIGDSQFVSWLITARGNNVTIT